MESNCVTRRTLFRLVKLIVRSFSTKVATKAATKVCTAASVRWFLLASVRRIKRSLLVLALVMGCHMARADVVLEWNDLMIDAIRTDNSGPTISTRNLALLHTAIYDAVNSVARTHQAYRFQADALENTSIPAAAAGAGHRIMQTLYPTLSSHATALLAAQVAALPDDDARVNGLALGEHVAGLILVERQNDGANTEVPYIPSNAPGQWQRTPPFFRPPHAPHWRHVRPFCIPEIDPFLPPSPPALDSAEYARDLEEVRMVGGVGSAMRSEEQSLIAVFWSDFSYTSMPPGHWHLIAADIARDRRNTLLENARLFALLSLAHADAAIVCWEAKYRHNLWRPVTAIRRADEDGNPDTTGDPDWNHFLDSPPFPAYTSGHSTFSHAGARVLGHFYGTDAITFAATSDSLPGVLRTYDSLTACADEVGMSRIYGGIHFQFDNLAGRESGTKLGNYVSANFLLPMDHLPFARLERASGGVALVRAHAQAGRLVELQSSSNLVDWTSVETRLAVSGGTVFEHEIADQPMQFYRLVQPVQH
jgi:hypothetical protein